MRGTNSISLFYMGYLTHFFFWFQFFYSNSAHNTEHGLTYVGGCTGGLSPIFPFHPQQCSGWRVPTEKKELKVVFCCWVYFLFLSGVWFYFIPWKKIDSFFLCLTFGKTRFIPCLSKSIFQQLQIPANKD